MKKIKKKIDAMLIKRKCVSGVTVIENGINFSHYYSTFINF